VKGLTFEEKGSTAAAKAIMTTDTFHKEKAISIGIDGGEKGDGDGIRIGGIAKGSGMIFPQLATMLSFIYTDVDLSAGVLRSCLKDAVDNSFNMVVVDGDMSTNDLVLVVSTGESGRIREEDFKEGLNFVCKEFAKLIARDGEGATKFIEARVKGAASLANARKVAKSIVRSPLVKCSVFGESPNWGRIIAAIGSSFISGDVDLGRISISFKSEIGEAMVVKKGQIIDLLGVAKNIMKGKEIIIAVDLGIGDEEVEATAWGCDLSYDYIGINAGLVDI
jgi:glutamate N-acetyltransferase/amino-acid N-acetyltransferase